MVELYMKNRLTTDMCFSYILGSVSCIVTCDICPLIHKLQVIQVM